MNRFIRGPHEGGAVILTVAMLMLFLLGFMGIALDFSRLFIVKTELQTAMDSCALAAAQELDGKSDALDRAVSAGMTAGNLNRVDLQSADWRGKGQISVDDITFKDNAYANTIVPANATYVQCKHTQSGVKMWLMNAMHAFSSTSPTLDMQDVLALAVARRSPGQTTCPLPVALKPKGSPPDYGFTVGDWVTLVMAQNAAAGGEIGWVNLDGSNSASETEAELNGKCDTRVGDNLGTPGVQTAVADVWNYRFGIYKNTGDPSVNRPDFTGYAYTSTNWKSGRNAYNGTPGAGSPSSAQNFLTKRLAYASCADTGTKVKGADSCESITGLSLNSFQKLAAPGNLAGGHKQYGSNRRIAPIPVVNNAGKVEDFVCMLMLQPLSIPMTDVQLEYLGNASDPASPCTTSGVPGGVAGPLVPVLVQ
jgi:hypothetical protein